MTWRKLSTLPYRDAWVMRVAANVAIDALRRRHRILLAGAGADGVAGRDT